jgi:long-chain acyl-CoA synthetase
VRGRGETTTVYPQTNADESANILADSGSRVLIAEDAGQVANVVEKRAQLPELTPVVVIDPAASTTDEEWILSLGELEARGRARLEVEPELIKGQISALTKDRLATLIYASGTTGRPKGVRLPHDNWAYMAKATAATGLLRATEVEYMWLPLSHVFGKALTSTHIEVGHVIAVDSRADKITEKLPVVRPTYMAAVPRIFGKVYNGVAAKARTGGGISAGSSSGRRSPASTPGSARIPSGPCRPARARDRLVYAKIRQAFGGRLRICVSGSASLAPEIAYFFLRLPHQHGRQATARHRGPDRRRRRDPPARPRHHAELPRAARQDRGGAGAGRLVPHRRHRRAVGRRLSAHHRPQEGPHQESGGKYIAPAEVEGQFKAVCPYVSNILVHGADRAFCTALIALDEPSIIQWAGQNAWRARRTRRSWRRRPRSN